MIVRPAHVEDFLEIAALDRVAWAQNRNSEFIPDGEHIWRHWIEDGLVFVAEEEHEIKGAVIAFRALKGHFVGHKMFVARATRGQGIGRKLLATLLAEIDQYGESCYLTVDPVNTKAIALYESLGFSEREFVKGYYREIEDRFVMTRPGQKSV